MRKLIILSLFLFFLLSHTDSLATHLAGGQVTYEHISGKKYGVTVTIFRDCRGISLSFAQLNVKCTNGGSASASLTRTSITTISPSGCIPQNTYTSGNGREKHTFYAIIDFASTPYSSLASCSGKIVFSASLNARNSSITTGPTGTQYLEATLDLSATQNNSSPAFDFDPINSLCCNTPARLSWSCSDVDGDSLSYEWTSPLRAYNTNVAFYRGFAYYYPIQVYYPSGVTYPTATPNAKPPVGLYLNANSGEVVFTPTNCTQTTVLTIKRMESQQ